MNFNVQVTPLSYMNSASKVNMALAESKPISISVREFSDLICRKKYSFNSCIHKAVWNYSENRLAQSSETAVSWQILALDFEMMEEIVIALETH